MSIKLERALKETIRQLEVEKKVLVQALADKTQSELFEKLICALIRKVTPSELVNIISPHEGENETKTES